jgi:hypothetical protein
MLLSGLVESCQLMAEFAVVRDQRDLYRLNPYDAPQDDEQHWRRLREALEMVEFGL